MAQIIVRNLDDSVVEKLKRRAEAAGRSLEAEVRILLTDAVEYDFSRLREIRSGYGRKFDDSTDLIREDRKR